MMSGRVHVRVECLEYLLFDGRSVAMKGENGQSVMSAI